MAKSHQKGTLIDICKPIENRVNTDHVFKCQSEHGEKNCEPMRNAQTHTCFSEVATPLSSSGDKKESPELG